jgi:UDP-2,3-diacylglucosamine hydrolase
VQPLDQLGIIAGNGIYPQVLAQAARSAGVRKIVAVAFSGETDPKLGERVDEIYWLRVGQLNRMLSTLRDAGITSVIMAGQIAPKNLFDLRPDWKALLLLARLKRRNAESIFAAIAGELSKVGIEILPATSFLDQFLATPGLIAGPKLSRREEDDINFGWEIAKQISRLDIGQTVLVKNGTVLAVEAFEGTNEALQRGGMLAGKDAVMVKVAKPNQDLRFDVPVIGPDTLRLAAKVAVRVIAVEAGKTLLLEKESLIDLAERSRISLIAR